MVWEPNPARDAVGNVLPHDDPVTIPSEWTLLRHVHPEQWAPDERTGSPRPQSNAFAFSTEGSRSMSVDIEPPMLVEGLTPTYYAFRAGKGVVRVTAAKARELHLRVGPEPIPGNPHHGGIWAPNPAIPKSQLDRHRRALSRNCEVVALPPARPPPLQPIE
jgi:hypothetical protein